MAREAEEAELALLRSDHQRSRTFLWIDQPPAVFKARVNQSFSSDDSVVEVIYNEVEYGAHTDILLDQLVYVSEFDWGLYDRGMARVRKTPTSSKLYIGEISEIDWENDLYLTVVDEFLLVARHLAIGSQKQELVDYEIAYSNQHATPDPVPVLGSHAVLWLGGETVSITLNGNDSWVVSGSISSHSWSAPGASATSGMDTATPTITYNATGRYRVSDTLTAGGKTFTGYRKIRVFSADDMPITNFTFGKVTSDYESGGHSFSVTLYDEADLTLVRDRALVVLFSEDWYDEMTKISIGPQAGRENIIAIGHISEESIVQNPEYGTVEFTVEGAHKWLKRIMAFPIGMEDSGFANNGGGAADNWNQFQTLTVDKCLWHLLHWRSTATRCMDVYPTEDTRRAPALEAPPGNLWQQLIEIANATILAMPCCDLYDRLYIEVDSQLMPEDDRDTIPIVQEITKADWADEISPNRVDASSVSQIDASGVSYLGGAKANPLFSLAPGHVFKLHGSVEVYDRLLIANQSQLNTLAGLLLSKFNNEFSAVGIPLGSNNRLISICPRQYVTLSLNPSDTPRGITWDSRKLIPRRVVIEAEEEGNYLRTTLECEAETFEGLAITIIKPPTPVDNEPIQPNPWDPDWEPTPIPGPGPLPPIFPPFYPPPIDVNDEDCDIDMNAPENGPWIVYDVGGTLYDNDMYSLQMPFMVYLRSSGHVSGTTYRLEGDFEARDPTTNPIGEWTDTLTDDWYNVYALNESYQRIATGIHDSVSADGSVRTGHFDNVDGVDIWALEIELTPITKNVDHIDHTRFYGFGGINATLEEGYTNWEYIKGALFIEFEDHVRFTSGGSELQDKHTITIFDTLTTDEWFRNSWTEVTFWHTSLLSSTGSGGSPYCDSHYTEEWDDGFNINNEFYWATEDLRGQCIQNITHDEELGLIWVPTPPAEFLQFKNRINYPAAGTEYLWIYLWSRIMLRKAASKRLTIYDFSLYNLCNHSSWIGI